MSGRRPWRGIDNDPGWINRKFRDLEAQVRQLRSERRLPASSVPGSVVTITEILTNPTGSIQFQNTDTATCPADGANILIPLSHIPKPGSEQVFYNGTPLKRRDWSRTDTVLTIPGEPWFRANRVAWVDYSYDATRGLVGPTIQTPVNGSATTDLTPTVSGTAAALRAIQVFIDGAWIGTTTSTAAGVWTIDVPSALSVGIHVASALQVEPDGTYVSADPVSFSVILVPATFSTSTYLTSDHSTIAIPGPPTSGDLLVLAISSGGGAGCPDARFTARLTSPGMGVWTAVDDGTGTPVSVLMDSTTSSGGADSVAAIMRIKGSPLLPVTSEATSTGSGATFSPTIPTLGSFGVLALTSATGLVSASVSDDTLGNWTTHERHRGGGPGRVSLLLATATGLPAAAFANAGSGPTYAAWVAGLQ